MDATLSPEQSSELEAPRPRRRVLHVLKYYRPTFSGEGIFLERSSAVMQELAPEVSHELLVTHTPRPADEAAVAACTTLERVTYLTKSEPGTLRRHLLLVWWLLLNIRRYDVVHVRTHADWYFLSYLLAWISGRRLVLSATLDDSLLVLTRRYRPQLRAIAARGFALFDAYISISPKLQAENIRAGADPARCHLVPCGVTVPPVTPAERNAVRASLGIGEADPVLLFVGGLCERKDPMFLVDALPRLRRHHPRLRLVLVGPPLEPDYVAEMCRRVAATGLEEAVHFVGEQRNPHPWFAAADILVFASKLEGFGTVVPEGMAHGLPVVVRRLAGVNDTFVLEGETGYLFNDEATFDAAVDRLTADPVLRRRLGEAGRSLARAEFSMIRIATRYLGIYGFEPAPTVWAAKEETGLGCNASISDRRFHSPVPAPREPLLITMVDAEEGFDWSHPFSRNAVQVGSMGSQRLAHRIFERHGVIPLYLVDYPVVDQDAGRAPLRELLADARCEIGTQLHPWVTPPYAETVNERNSFAGNLPPALEFEKAHRLTEKIEESLRVRPEIYRTGRFGYGPRTADILKRLGYTADSSVVPYWPSQRLRRGAWTLPGQPYWIDKEKTLMEIPVASALVGHLAGRGGDRLARYLFHPAAGKLALTGASARLGMLERIRLSPEGITVSEAKRLTRAMIAQGQNVFVLTYHSPSLEPGNTPYVRTLEDRDKFLNWLDEFYTFFRAEMGGRCTSWREVRFGPDYARRDEDVSAVA